MRISAAWRSLWLFVLAMVPVAVFVFLVSSDFFAGWDGHAVSVRPPRNPDEPVTYTVLIAQADADPIERLWPAARVEGLGLPTDPLAIPPTEIPEGRPATVKHRFSLHYRIQEPGGTWEVVPTTSPSALGLGLLALLLGIALRNMVVSGSPVSIEPRRALLPRAQAAPGQVAPPPRAASRGQKGPPPSRPRRGRGRR